MLARSDKASRSHDQARTERANPAKVEAAQTFGLLDIDFMQIVSAVY